MCLLFSRTSMMFLLYFFGLIMHHMKLVGKKRNNVIASPTSFSSDIDTNLRHFQFQNLMMTLKLIFCKWIKTYPI
eukprot:UN09697